MTSRFSALNFTFISALIAALVSGFTGHSASAADRFVIPHPDQPVAPGNLQIEMESAAGVRYVDVEFPIIQPHAIVVQGDRAEFYLRATPTGPGPDESDFKSSAVKLALIASSEVDVRCEEVAAAFSFSENLARCSVRLKNARYPFPDLRPLITKKVSEWIDVRATYRIDVHPVEMQPRKMQSLEVDLKGLVSALRYRLLDLRMVRVKAGRKTAPEFLQVAETLRFLGPDPCGLYRPDLRGFLDKAQSRNVFLFSSTSVQTTVCAQFRGAMNEDAYTRFRVGLYDQVLGRLELDARGRENWAEVPEEEGGVEKFEIETQAAGVRVSDAAREVAVEVSAARGLEAP